MGFQEKRCTRNVLGHKNFLDKNRSIICWLVGCVEA